MQYFRFLVILFFFKLHILEYFLEKLNQNKIKINFYVIFCKLYRPLRTLY